MSVHTNLLQCGAPAVGGLIELRVREAGKPYRIEDSYGVIGNKTVGSLDINLAAPFQGISPAMSVGVSQASTSSDLWVQPGVAVPAFKGFVQATAGIGIRGDLQPTDPNRDFTGSKGQIGTELRVLIDQNLTDLLSASATIVGGTRLWMDSKIYTQDNAAPYIEINQHHGGGYGTLKVAADARITNHLYVPPEVVADVMTYKQDVTTSGVTQQQQYSAASLTGFVFIGVNLPDGSKSAR